MNSDSRGVWRMGWALFLAALAAVADAGNPNPPTLEDALQEWEADLHAPVKWEPLAVVDAASRNGKLEPQPDSSLKAPPNLASRELYTIRATSGLQGITAFRVEVLPEQGSAGRTGAAVLTEFRVSAARQPVKFSAGSADFAKRGAGPQLALDGDAKTGWSLAGATDQPHAAVFELSGPLTVEAGTILTFSLHQDHPAKSLNRIRISATTKAPPVRELPESIRQTIALEPSERTEAQRAELLAYFRSTSKAPAPKRARIKAK